MELFKDYTLETKSLVKLSSIFLKEELPHMCLLIEDPKFRHLMYPELISMAQLDQIYQYKLPTLLFNRLKDVIVYMANELYNWLYKNKLSKPEIDKEAIAISLCWTLKGDIDFSKTVNNLKNNDAISTEKKFELCCNHCFEDDVISFWDKLSSEFQRDFLLEKFSETYYYHDYWLNRLGPKIPPQTDVPYIPSPDLEIFSNRNFDIPSFEPFIEEALVKGNTFTQMFFWEKLTPDEKNNIGFKYLTYIMDAFYKSNIEMPPVERIPDSFDIVKLSLTHWIWINDLEKIFQTERKSLISDDIYKMLDGYFDIILEYFPVNAHLKFIKEHLWGPYKKKKK